MLAVAVMLSSHLLRRHRPRHGGLLHRQNTRSKGLVPLDRKGWITGAGPFPNPLRSKGARPMASPAGNPCENPSCRPGPATQGGGCREAGPSLESRTRSSVPCRVPNMQGSARSTSSATWERMGRPDAVFVKQRCRKSNANWITAVTMSRHQVSRQGDRPHQSREPNRLNPISPPNRLGIRPRRRASSRPRHALRHPANLAVTRLYPPCKQSSNHAQPSP